MARTAGVGAGISTPTSFVVTLEKAEIQRIVGGAFGILVTEQPTTIDVVANTGKSSALLGSGDVHQDTYQGVRLTLSADATYSGTDPCTGSPTTDSITLPGATNGQYVMDYEVPHPVRGLPQGAFPLQAFTIGADQVTTPMEFRIVFPVSNSIACVANTAPDTEIVGADTGIRTSYGMYLDPANNEIAVTNFNPNDSTVNSINFFQMTDNGDVLPTRVIQGSNTLLDQPWGLALDTHPLSGGGSIDGLFVTNSNTDQILLFDRAASGNTAPKVTISSASNCIDNCLDGVGGIYVDTIHGEIGITNGGPSDSVSLYDLTPVETDWVNNANGTTPIAETPTPRWTIKGPNTGLSTPCGIAYDQDTDEIFVGNNGNSSITVYQRPTNANTGLTTSPTTTAVIDWAPIRVIRGNHTNLSKICNVAVDPTNEEIAVANSGTSSVTFYRRADSGNVFPIRTLSGDNSGITVPVGLTYDTQNGYDQIGITDISTQSVALHRRADPNSSNAYGAVATPLKVPVLFAPTLQQNLYASFYFAGTIDRTTGAAIRNDTGLGLHDSAGDSVPPRDVVYDGYGISWKITDSALRQPNDAINAALIPPSAVTFTLANGVSASNLKLGCAAFTPFIIDVLTTYCKTQPMIVSPSPPVNDTYRVGAELLAKTIVQRMPLNISPLEISDPAPEGSAATPTSPDQDTSPEVSEWPRLVPSVDLSGNGSILDINWRYEDKAGFPQNSTLGNAPIIYNQAVTINGTQGFTAISSCYKQVGGNAPTLLFSTASLEPDVRSIADVKNNSCDIYLNDVATITFTVSDAFGNKYVYTWTPS
ncbi:MAG: hypothetical protein P8173_12980 [Gammaproteobacteria bacterium]